MCATPPVSDHELVIRARAGDREAAGALAKRHTPMVVEQVRRLRAPPQVDTDELIQEGLICIARCATRWRPDGGSLFSTYCWRACSNAIGKALQRELRQ